MIRDYVTANERIKLQPREIDYLSTQMVIAEENRLKGLNEELIIIGKKEKRIKDNIKTLNRKRIWV